MNNDVLLYLFFVGVMIGLLIILMVAVTFFTIKKLFIKLYKEKIKRKELK